MKRIICPLTIVLCLYSCGKPNNNKSPELIIHNAYIYTVDSARTVYQAISVVDGLVSKLGDNATILALKGDNTRVIDASGAFVMPGIIEGHGHFGGLGRSLMNLNFLKAKSWDEIVAMVEEKVNQSEKGEWIVGRGWHQDKWTHQPHDHVHGYPKHLDLSKISPDNPVLLSHASGHGAFANAKAMELAGVSAETPNPVGGEIVKDIAGMPIGVFEERAQGILFAAYEEYLDSQNQEELLEEWYEGIEYAQVECLKHGITSFQDAGSSFEALDRYKEMANNDELDIRLWAMARHSSEKMRGQLAKYRAIDVGDGYYTCRAIKTELDGALGAYGAWLLAPYNDKAGFIGQNTTTVEEVNTIADLALKNDMQLCVHSIGDRANRKTLDIFEKKYKESGKDDLRWRIEHAQHIDPADIPRFGELGVIASMQAIHCTSDAPFVEKRLGPDRAKHGAYDWRAILDSGGIVTNGTDAPVEEVNPIPSYYASVTRKRADTGLEFYPENSMTRDEAIYSYTMACAYAAFEEDQKGSLEPGKYADITILSKNWMTCLDEEILDTKVLYTIVDGEVKYQADATDVSGDYDHDGRKHDGHSHDLNH